MNRIDQLQERVDKLPAAMVQHYTVRLRALVANRSTKDAFDEFERKLRIAEDLAGPMRTTPARRLRHQ